MVLEDNRSVGSYCLSPLGDGKTPGGCDDTGSFRERGLERREVEKRIYGVERFWFTASATFLLLRYFLVLNIE